MCVQIKVKCCANVILFYEKTDFFGLKNSHWAKFCAN